MYKHILIATDGSEIAARALDHGLALAAGSKAAVTVATVTEPWSAFDVAHDVRVGRPNPVQDYEAAMAASAGAILDAAQKKAKAAGVTCTTLHVKDRHPAEGIVETARANGCDLIVMASHGRRGLGRILLGSQAVEVLTHTKVPTLIVR